MSCNRCNRHAIRQNARRAVNADNASGSVPPPCPALEDSDAENIITDRFYCCGAPGSITRQLYSGPETDTLMSACYDSDGRSYRNAANRCAYWPNFAHPRWLSCEELYNKRQPRIQRASSTRSGRNSR